jgi:hypothetical protein
MRFGALEADHELAAQGSTGFLPSVADGCNSGAAVLREGERLVAFDEPFWSRPRPSGRTCGSSASEVIENVLLSSRGA